MNKGTRGLGYLALHAVIAGSIAVGTVAATQPAAVVEKVPTVNAGQICAPAPVRLAVVGDSITSWNPAYAGNKWQSWVYTATDNSLYLAGGYARPGAKLAELADNTRNWDVDVLVIMGGTNDLPIMAYGNRGTPVEERLAALDRIADRAGADRVVLSSVAPFGWNYAESQTWNEQLRQHAASRGWAYIDPWVGARDPNGAWWPWTDLGDRVHPNPSTAGYIGQQVRSALNALP